MTKSAVKFTSYEKAVERLEEITALLESGETGLENSIALYTEGLQLAKLCNEKLNEAESSIKQILEKNGVATEVDFATGSGDE